MQQARLELIKKLYRTELIPIQRKMVSTPTKRDSLLQSFLETTTSLNTLVFGFTPYTATQRYTGTELNKIVNRDPTYNANAKFHNVVCIQHHLLNISHAMVINDDLIFLNNSTPEMTKNLQDSMNQPRISLQIQQCIISGKRQHAKSTLTNRPGLVTFSRHAISRFFQRAKDNSIQSLIDALYQASKIADMCYGISTSSDNLSDLAKNTIYLKTTQGMFLCGVSCSPLQGGGMLNGFFAYTFIDTDKVKSNQLLAATNLATESAKCRPIVTTINALRYIKHRDTCTDQTKQYLLHRSTTKRFGVVLSTDTVGKFTTHHPDLDDWE